MIPIKNSLPYDIVRNEVFAQDCPFCSNTNVLIPITPEDIQRLNGGARKLTLIFPCCHGSLRLIDADQDYLLTNRPIRGK